ncbi:MAG: hypothetical protein MUE85_09435 [Microscillaceae bacterium]|jgi:hypothetical protein|nr:hypothetical protein [Microscillaceae bacterium]
MNNEGYVRRTDLYLRAVYPEIKTTIYKIKEQQFIIVCDKFEGDFQKFNEEFNYSIRLVSAPVDISEKTPKEFLEIIPNISDKDIPKNFEGVPFTKAGLLNLLISKFPNVHFQRIEDDAGAVIVYTASFEQKEGEITKPIFLNNSDREKIKDFLDNLKVPIQFSLVDEKIEQPQILHPFPHLNPVQFIYAANFKRELTPKFTLRDEALWFDNIDSIFKGKFKKDSLYFYDPKEYSCYVDFSSFENIDIRNHLFLFQTVYLTPPYEKKIDVWLKQSNIQKNEFLELVRRNRIKIALTQPESRYDIGFINEIYEINPNAVISRRALATLQQIDIVEVSDNYLFNDIDSLNELKKICEIMSDVTKINPKFVYDFLVWPIRARRNSFESLNSNGLFSMPYFGVNTVVEKRVSEVLKKDLSFEFNANSSSIHLANSLNAIYFPFKTKDGYSDAFYANVMGEMLNFYKSANIKDIKSFIESRQKINSGILPINPIDVIEVNEYISITELEEVLSRDVIYPNSKKLIESLSELTEEERKRKIAEYNLAVNEKINKKNKRKGAIDLGQNILLDVAGAITGFAIIGSTFSLLKLKGKKIMQSIPMIKNITAKIEDAMHTDNDKSNIHYLTKINRVARIRRYL